MNGKFFLNAREGAFCTPPNPTIESVSFSELEGRLVHAAFHETSFGDTLRLHIVNEHSFYVVSMFVLSRTATAFMLLAKNLDLHSNMVFKMHQRLNPVTGKQQDFFSINQNGGPLSWYYTEENKDEMPATAEEKKAFLRKIVEEELIPSLEKLLNPYPYHDFYKPKKTGLQGRYFDGFKADRPFVGMSAEEKANYK